MAQNRPFLSFPGKALTPLVLFYLFWGWTPANAVSSFGNLFGNDELIGSHFLAIVSVTAIPALLVIFGLRHGSVRGIRLLWVLSYLGAALLVFDAAIGMLMTGGMIGGTSHDQLAGEFILMATAVLAVLCFFLLRTMKRVRWLDPNSTPDEWEPKMVVGFRRHR